RGRLRLQETGLSAGAARPRPGARRPRGECPQTEPDHVARVTPDLFHAAHLERDHLRGDLLFRAAHHHAVLAKAPRAPHARDGGPGNLACPVDHDGSAVRCPEAPAESCKRGVARVAGFMTAEFWGRLLEIGFLNLLLSGDNAVVIALAVRALPR